MAEQLRGPEPRPFYSTRIVATHYRVSQHITARVFADLELAGILFLRRASRTWLRPTRPQPRRAVHGVATIPVWTTGYCRLPSWRRFLSRLQDHLRLHRFVPDLIFYESLSANPVEFAEHVLIHHPDTLIWFTPLPQHIPVLRQLRDDGVRVFVVTDNEFDYPFARYQLRWDRALRTGLREWHAAGIRELIVPQSEPDAPGTSLIEELAGETGLQCRFVHAADWRDLFTAAPRSQTAGWVFDDDLWCGTLCESFPHEMTALLRAARVLFLREINISRYILRDTRLDIAALPWEALAKQIAEDVTLTRPPSRPIFQTFQAKWRPRVPAANYAQ